MASNTVEALIGAVVLTAAGGFLVYAANTANISAGGGYELIAQFTKAEGISPGGDVRIGGVKIGSITSMELEPQNFKAVVKMRINDGVQLPEDTDVKITSSSLLGENFLAIQPGSEEFMLEPGDEIQYTQDSISIMDTFTKFVAGTGG